MGTDQKVAVITGASQGIGAAPRQGVPRSQLPGRRDRALDQTVGR